MLSNDKNIERIADLVEESKNWVGLRTDYAKIDTIDKVVKVLTALIFGFVMFLLILLILIYASFALAYFLSDMLGSMTQGFLVVTALYLLLLLIIYLNRHAWIEKPCTVFISSILETDGKTKEDYKKLIDDSEDKISAEWKGIFHDDAKKEDSPTQKFIDMIYSSAGIIDGALLGWKLYRKFGGTFSLFKKRKRK